MVSRRRALQFAAGTLASTAGCLGLPGGSDGDDTDPPTVTDGPVWTPGDVPTWRPEWTERFDGWHVLGLDAADGLLYVTLSSDDGPSAVAAVDPAERTELWRTESEGEAVAHSHVGYQGVSRGQWGVTPTDDAVYAVAGPAEEREWTALHALDRATGARRWSLRRDRDLGVAGVEDGLVVATGLEFFPPADQTPVSHQTPDEPLVTVVYGVDAADGTVRWTREFDGVEDVATNADGVCVAAGDHLVGLARDGATRFTYGEGPSTRVVAATDRVYYLTGEEASATVHGVATGGGADWTHDVPVREPILDGDRLAAGGDAVVAVDPDGTVVWRDDDHGQWLLVDPDGDTLYTRSGSHADAATAYDTGGGERWTFDPPSNNAWPEAATADALAATAITPERGEFNTVYAVDSNGRATAAMERDGVFEALGLGGTVFVADGESRLQAFVP
jgi:hypothetical protein